MLRTFREIFTKSMTITRTEIRTRKMKHDKEDDDDCDGDDKDEDEDKMRKTMTRTTTTTMITMARMATIVALTAGGKQQDPHVVAAMSTDNEDDNEKRQR